MFGRTLGIIFLALTLGQVQQIGTDTFIENLFSAKTTNVLMILGIGSLSFQHYSQKIFLTAFKGVINNVGNFLITNGASLAGLSIAFPISAATGIIVGTTVNYLADPRGNLLFLAGGVTLALCAIACLTVAYHLRTKTHEELEAKMEEEMKEIVVADERGERNEESDNKKESSEGVEEEKEAKIVQVKEVAKKKSKVVKGISLIVLSGVLVSVWSPIAAIISKGEGKLNSYSILFYLYVSGLLANIPMLPVFMRYPLTDLPPVKLSSYLEISWAAHLWGLFGGFLSCAGTMLYLLASKTLGFAVSFALGQSGPMISCIFGIFVWKEFEGVTRKTKMYIIFTFLFYSVAICLISAAK